MRKIYNKAIEFFTRARQYFYSPYFGFIQGHAHLKADELRQISQLVGDANDAVVVEFESKFAQLIGTGEAIAYAAARMGFYDLMKLQGIGKGDEVILQGATCAVMVNAILRTGARPIFSDIDPNTFGSSKQAIATCITSRTRMIVAQHSFGIPCDIEPIVQLAKEKNIFLLEDSALTLGSSIDGISVGNFGDAALFSTDHSKPLNTLIGGLIYTKNGDLAKRLRASQAACADLSAARQNALWNRLLLEAKYCDPSRYGQMGLIDLFSILKKKIARTEGDFLTDDFGTNAAANYPYPARLPAFLAFVGLIEIERWQKVSNDRKILLHKLIHTLSEIPSGIYLPGAYKNTRLDIVPLRVVWHEPTGPDKRNLLSKFIHVSWTWFLTPIIATKEPLEKLGYQNGACPISEMIGNGMINLPCIFESRHSDKFIGLLKKALF